MVKVSHILNAFHDIHVDVRYALGLSSMHMEDISRNSFLAFYYGTIFIVRLRRAIEKLLKSLALINFFTSI